MYTVVGATKSRAFRVMWMLEELGENYTQIDAGPRSPEAKEYNPTGKIPALLDGDEVLTDSVAIMTYLGDKHGKLTAPAGTIARARQDAMTFWLIDEFDAILWAAAKHSFVFPEEQRVPEVKDSLKAEFTRAADLLARRLQGPFLLGDQMT
ncbi:MAG: glutathione S-transferase family protein, partial [Sulfitobacter geojensis]